MDFDFSEAEIAFCEKLKGLLGSVPEKGLSRFEKDKVQESRKGLLDWLEKLAGVDYLSLGMDPGSHAVTLTAAQEELAALDPSLFLAAEVSARIFGRLLAVYGTPEQKEKILPGVTGGRLIGAVGLSEGGMNIENEPLGTRGVKSDTGLLVSGTKAHVVNAPVADWFAVAGNFEQGPAFFLMENGHEGLSLSPGFTMTGYRGVAVSTLTLEKAPVPPDRVIGPFKDDQRFKTVRSWEDQILTAAGLGVMKAAYETARNHAKTHMSGGKPIIAYQEVGFKLSEMLTLFQTAQLLAYRAAWMVEAGQREAPVVAHCAKVFCAESAEKVASEALQILGAQGCLQGNPAEEGYCNAKYLQVAGTSTEISRMKIGDGVLG